MYSQRLLRLGLQAARRTPARPSSNSTLSTQTHLRNAPLYSLRLFSTTPLRKEKDEHGNELDAATTAGQPGESGDHEGQFARTDESVRVEYPEEDQLPRSQPVQGRGGPHMLPTLASFSLDGRVGVVTGGARGLGLVMAQAFVMSGADVAIVDMNSTSSICGPVAGTFS
jgi:D-arabinitol 2-dehydrogenase